MGRTKEINIDFQEVIAKLGFAIEDDCLYLTENKKELPDPQIQFHIEKAKELNASAVYLRRQLNGSYKPQVYLFDYTDRGFNEANEDEIADIQTNIWSSGEAPLACIFHNTSIQIIDCTKHITKNYKPEYLVKDLKLFGKISDLYNNQFAIKIKSGIFWEQEELKNKFKFQNSAYDKLIDNIRFVANKLTKEFKNVSTEIVNKIIVQAILIKYLEERIDDNGNKLLSNKYFQKYNKASSFNDVLKQQGKFVELLSDLNKDFNGNVFKWEAEEEEQLKVLNLTIVADLLATDKTSLDSEQLELDFPDWRYFEFKLIPVELISRLYEEFLGEDKQEKGLYYTPSHLAKLLVDECIPLKKFKDFDLKNYTILDPACGSGIFLVVVFKRLVQIWRLQQPDINTKPDIDDLKSILKNIYGVDKEEQAVRLASFSLSLALCNELNPVKILNQLRFDDLTKSNLIHSDFFECKSIENKKFDLLIGNPPFVRGKLPKGLDFWEINKKKIDIPQKQIALKFLSESFRFLKDNGLTCLIIKSSGLLYNSSSANYKKALFSNYNAIQIFDFTALAEGKSLWDNGARVGSAAIFIKNEKPDFSKNILHLTFRRTIATKERIVFEIDDYDLHFVNRETAINNEFIWKVNILGGGRIKNIMEKLDNFPLLKPHLVAKGYTIQEGHGTVKNNSKNPTSVNKRLLSSKGIVNKTIDSNRIEIISPEEMIKINDIQPYHIPSLIISETIDIDSAIINLAINKDENLIFKNRYVGISSPDKDVTSLEHIFNNIVKHEKLYTLQFIIKSAQLLGNRNTAILAYDLYNLRYISDNSLSEFDNKVIDDVLNYFQKYLRIGESAKAVSPIRGDKNIKTIIGNYGSEFSKALNTIYEENNRKFRLSDVIQLENSLIATVFKYDSENVEPKFSKDLSELNIDGLTTNEISAHLSVNRIIKLYPQKDTIVFVKPNQYRYWLSLTAYRDADKCFSDFSNAGF
ncbi:HsdM family class I SAM-dependent methyltransferase [Kaistella carnis]|uniref:HsdM family class I SAM-dependent methyltransferase n=1 Tax=Kaistella carnis TaxID=1241979 RepID=UPI0028A1E8AE|nr:N-6 DNA methylase [Kaistella carnis]